MYDSNVSKYIIYKFQWFKRKRKRVGESIKFTKEDWANAEKKRALKST